MTRPKDRVSSKGLLPRMEARPWSDGVTVSYRYKPISGKPIPLGTDKLAACRKVLDLLGKRDNAGTLGWVWEKFTENSPKWKKLAAGTQADYRLAWKQIEQRFGDNLAANIESTDIAKYVHLERAGSPRRADIEKSLLSRLFGYGITLGACKINPTIGVEAHGSEAKTEAPDAGALAAFLAWLAKQTPQRRIIGMAAEYASLAGSRRIEFLDLAWPQIDEKAGVIRTKRAKQRGKKRGEVVEVLTITPNLQSLIDRLKALRAERGTDCLYVFPTRENNAYSTEGFETLWQRCVLAAIAAGIVTREQRFSFHDLRAHYATVHKQETGELPDLHKNPDTTARVYDRNKEVRRRAL